MKFQISCCQKASGRGGGASASALAPGAAPQSRPAPASVPQAPPAFHVPSYLLRQFNHLLCFTAALSLLRPYLSQDTSVHGLSVLRLDW